MKRKIPDTISEEELITILKKTKDNKKRAAYLYGFYEQLRISEVVKLKREDIETTKNYIKIKQAKGGKDRQIAIIKPLLLRKNEVKLASKYFPVGSTKAKDLGIRNLQIAFKRIAKKVLSKDLHFHCLRHSGASWLLNKKKWDIRHVQKQLGHSKIATTEIYTHVGGGDLVDLEWD